MKENHNQTIAVVGAGAWGTALAQVCANAGCPVLLYAREPDVAESIRQNRENSLFLPGVPLSAGIESTTDLARCAECDILLIVTPAQHVRKTLETLKPTLRTGHPVLLCAKGIEIETGALLSTIASTLLPKASIGILSGPTFAREIAIGLPGAATIAMPDPDLAIHMTRTLGNKKFRLYPSDDVTGVEIGGAIKNVIAIAAGIVAGRGLGDTARAALITRGIAEMVRLAITMGGRRETLMGLSGMGDLILTATSVQSRNYTLGLALGQGRSLSDILAERHAVTEGVHTAKAVHALALSQGVDMPICAAMQACLIHGKSIDSAIETLLNRPVRFESF